jgi:hypothetical protein
VAKNQAGLDKRQRVVFEVIKNGGSSRVEEAANIDTSNFKYIKSISENVSCDQNQDVLSFTHSINVKLTIYNGQGVDSAKDIADSLLDVAQVKSNFQVNYNNEPLKVFYDETYDEPNSECNFNKKYEIATNTDSTNNYMLFRSNSLSYDSSGVATVTENAEYQSLTSGGVGDQAAGDIDNAFNRCSAILNSLTNASTNVGEFTLIDIPLVKALVIDNDNRKASYNVKYSTNIKINKDLKVYHEYTSVTETTNAGITYYSLEGNIVGMGEISSSDDMSQKYKNAKGAWKSIVGGAWPMGTKSGKPYSFSTNHNYIKGTINYSIKYSSCTSIIAGAGKIRRKIHKIETQPVARPLFQTFRVINHDEVAQAAEHGNKLGSHYKETSIINGDSTVVMKELLGDIQNASPEGTHYGLSTNLSFNSTSRQLTATMEAMIIP